MTKQSEHLSNAQIENYGNRTSGAGPDANQPDEGLRINAHLESCPSCRSQLLDFHRASFGLLADPQQLADVQVNTAPTPECPSTDALRQLAAGLTVDDTAATLTEQTAIATSDALTAKLLQHAATCNHCGPLLRAFAEDFSDDFTPEEQAALANLQSSSAAWQKVTAREMLQAGGVSAAEDSNAAAASTTEGGSSRTAATVKSDEQRSGGTAVSSAPGHKPFFWKRVLIPATAAIVAIAAFSVWYTQRDTPEKVEKLLAQAYTEQRNIELRLPGAPYAPIRIERADGDSQFAKPKSLIEAEFRISEKLEKNPNDPALLKAKAEAELLTLNYKAAITTLEKALRLAPNSPEILETLGIAHFESAEHGPQEYRQQAFAKALDEMSAALKQSPRSAHILFNRAILQEKMSFFNQAIADWEMLLEIERDSGWRNEAQKHLAGLRQKLQSIRSGALDDRAPPDNFLFLHDRGFLIDPENLLQNAERNVLPSISSTDISDPNFKNAVAMAGLLKRNNGDPFLSDVLKSAAQPAFRRAAKLLGSASVENGSGEAETAYKTAYAAEAIFRTLANEAGISAALFEQAYSLQFQSKALGCAQKAEESLAIAKHARYYWIEIQASIEQATCLNMVGKLDRAGVFCDNAILLARRQGFRSFYLRALLLKAALKENIGDEAGAFNDTASGLEEYFRGGISNIRAYSFYDLISDIAERSRFDHVKLEAALEQAAFLPGNPNLEVVASAHFRIANVALDLGESRIAEDQFKEGSRVISRLPRTESVLWRLLEANTGLARAQLGNPNQRDQALATLQSFAGELSQIHNRYVEQDYFTTLGEIKAAKGELEEAKEAYARAIALSETERSSAQYLEQALIWADQNRRPYLLMSKLLFEMHQPDQALSLWSTFRSAPFHRERALDTNSLGKSHFADKSDSSSRISNIDHHSALITYALLPDGILVWIDGPYGKNAQKVAISMELFRQISGKFMEECARADTPIDELQADSRILYSWLIEPVKSQLPASGKLFIRPDGILQVLPWEALVDSTDSYLRTRYSIIIAPIFQPLSHDPNVKVSDKALIVGVPGVLGADSEAENVATFFQKPTLLRGVNANVEGFKREIRQNSVLHFAGHAVQQANGPALVLTDGVFGASEGKANQFGRNQGESRHLKLAVFSACDTAGSGYGGGSRTATLVAAFLDSGTEIVIASRWNVDSGSTAEFMAAFYQKLVGEGLSSSGALQLTAATVAKDSRHSHPYYWAAFGQFVAN